MCFICLIWVTWLFHAQLFSSESQNGTLTPNIWILLCIKQQSVHIIHITEKSFTQINSEKGKKPHTYVLWISWVSQMFKAVSKVINSFVKNKKKKKGYIQRFLWNVLNCKPFNHSFSYKWKTQIQQGR